MIKFIVITDFYHFYFFRAKEFENFFYKNPIIQKHYKNFVDKKGTIARTNEFYEHLKNALNSKAYENSLRKEHLFDASALELFHLDLTPILKGNQFTQKRLELFFKTFHKDFLFDKFNPNPTLFD